MTYSTMLLSASTRHHSISTPSGAFGPWRFNRRDSQDSNASNNSSTTQTLRDDRADKLRSEYGENVSRNH